LKAIKDGSRGESAARARQRLGMQARTSHPRWKPGGQPFGPGRQFETHRPDGVRYWPCPQLSQTRVMLVVPDAMPVPFMGIACAEEITAAATPAKKPTEMSFIMGFLLGLVARRMLFDLDYGVKCVAITGLPPVITDRRIESDPSPWGARWISR
jgi:hypothetical protein